MSHEARTREVRAHHSTGAAAQGVATHHKEQLRLPECEHAQGKQRRQTSIETISERIIASVTGSDAVASWGDNQASAANPGKRMEKRQF